MSKIIWYLMPFRIEQVIEHLVPPVLSPTDQWPVVPEQD